LSTYPAQPHSLTMASGRYQAPSLEEPTGFGNVSSDSRNASGSSIASPPLFGIDYKKWVTWFSTAVLK